MEEYMDIAVAGLHLSGQPLNYQLVSLGGRLKKTCFTAPKYKMFLIKDEKGMKPGLVRLSNGQLGGQYELEVWELPVEHAGRFIAQIPAPLGIGTLMLENGETVKGFICEPLVVQESEDISLYPGWRAFIAAR